MTFLHPWVLLLIIGVLALWILFIVKGQKKISHIFSEEVYAKLVRNSKALSYEARLALFVLAMIFMIIALAQPVIEKEKVKVTQRTIDIVAALDISVSMEARDLFPNRLAWAKKKLLDFIAKSEGLRVGVMAFASYAYVVTPMTEDKEVARYLVENLDTDSMTEKGTNLMQLLDAAQAQLKDKAHHYVILFTDGGDNKSYKKEIAYAKEHDMTLFVLGVGTRKGAPVIKKDGTFIKRNGEIVLTRLNEAIKDLALQTGGVYIHSLAGEADIEAMIKEIKSIAQEEELSSKELRRYVELFAYFLVAAAVMLLYAFSSVPHKKSAALLALIFCAPMDMRAGLLDFQNISEAKEFYQNGAYQKSEKAWKTLEATDEVRYNQANALYKQKKFKEAAKLYESIKKPSLQHRALHNLGNSYAKSKAYKKAIEAYERALKLKKDQETKENLEAVKKLFKKQKEQKNQQQNNKKQKDKQNQEKSNQKNQKKNQKSKNNQQNQQNQQKKSQNKSQNQSQKKKPNKPKKQKNQAAKKDKKEQSAKKEKAPKPSQKAQTTQTKLSQKELSDKEEKKLMRLLRQEKGSTYRYTITSPYQKEKNETPW